MRLSSAVCGSLLLLAPLSLAAQTFPVNKATAGWQQCPAVLAHPEGGYLVVFASTTLGVPTGPKGVFAQRFSLSGERIGAELTLDSAESSECLTAVPAGPGRLLVAWGVHNGIGQQAIYARYFDVQGNPLSPKFKAGEGMSYLQPGAACDAEGRCWIVWIDRDVASVRARRFALSGQPLGDEIRVDAPGDGERWDLKLSADPQGGFVSSWWNGSTETGPPEEPQPPPNGQVRIRRVSAAGELLGEEIALDPADTVFAYSEGAVCNLPGGGFLAAVSRVRIDLGGPDDILLRRFDGSGAPAGPARPAAAADSPQSLGSLHLACGPDRVLLLWIDLNDAGPVSLFGRFFTLSGEPSGAPFLISEPGGRSSAALLGSDSFLAVWEAYRPDNGIDIFGRAYRTAASPLSLHGGRFKVEATFRDPRTRVLAPAEPKALTEDTGFFWFFNSANRELVVKTLDGCAVNGHFWVFAAGLTDVESEITVTDTVSGSWKSYRNPPHTAFLPIQDTRAFDCP
jgi:hypothetical protein